jgi:hypothetical protein
MHWEMNGRYRVFVIINYVQDPMLSGGSYAWHHRLVVQARVRSNEKQQTSGSKRWDDVVSHLLAVRHAKIVRIVMYAPDLIGFAESPRAVLYPVILSYRRATEVPVSFKSGNR